MTTPLYSAPINGIIGNAGATAASAQVNQLFGTHSDQVIYPGTPVVTPLNAITAAVNMWNAPLSTQDVDQPFTMSGTSIGRVTFPILPIGNGADLLVSLMTDSSGSPGTLIAQTRIPAAWIYQLSAVVGSQVPAGTAPVVSASGNPLALAQTYAYGISGTVQAAYQYPAAFAPVGTSAAPAATYYNGYLYLVGGVTNGNAVSTAFSISYDSAGNLGNAIPEPAFPTNNDGSSASIVAIDSVSGSAVLINCGGGTSFGGSPVATVYSAAISDTDGSLSQWTQMTSLPAANQSHTMATYNGYVYSIGGKNSTGTLNTVQYGLLQNGQITSWAETTPLPIQTSLAYVGVAPNGVMVVAGGTNASFSPSYTQTWFTQVDASTGKLGSWFPGPNLPSGFYDLNCNPYVNDFGFYDINNALTLPINTNGPAFVWGELNTGTTDFPGYYDFGNGQVLAYAFNYGQSEYAYLYFNIMPTLSVPLPASGLTSTSTYHVLLQQQGGDASDYLVTSISEFGYNPSTGPTVLTSPQNAWTWTAGTAHTALPVTVYNNTVPTTIGLPYHTWEDNGAKVTQVLQANSPDARVLGLLEAVRTGAQVNQNSGFETGILPWTINFGTVAQSTSHSFTGSHSAMCTPNGTSTQCYLQSEQMVCMPGQFITVEAWVWLTTSVTANLGASINWYTATGGYMSTTSNSLNATGGQFNFIYNINAQAPTGAYRFSLDIVLGGTPPSSNVFFIDNAVAYYSYTGVQQYHVSEFNWAQGWNGTSVDIWPPESISVIA
jgi:hypothetical protein